MLVNPAALLVRAREGKYAIGAFNTSDLEMTQAIIEAAEELNAPVIIQITKKAIEYGGLEELAGLVKTMAQKAKIPVGLNLDHAKDPDTITQALNAGFTSIMFDGSALPFEENLAKTKEIVALAKEKDVQVEGEVGPVGSQNDTSDTLSQYLADPQQAERFASESGVDSLAVALGTAHGQVIEGEKINLERLGEISSRVSLPLVLHGSSGLPKEDIQKAISLGIAKVNIDTDLRIAFSEGLKESLSENPEEFDPRKILSCSKEEVKETVKEKIQIFGSSGKA